MLIFKHIDTKAQLIHTQKELGRCRKDPFLLFFFQIVCCLQKDTAVFIDVFELIAPDRI